MHARHAATALALAAALVLAGCLGGLGAGSAAQPGDANAAVQGSGDDATVVVGGEAAVSAEPDAATVGLTVVAAGDDPETVRDRLARNASAVRGALTAYGLDDEQVRSERFRIRENRRDRREGDDAPAYVGEHRLTVELDDVDAVGEVIDVALAAGPVEVDGVRFGLSDERRAELRDQALERAVADARSEAELVAAAEDLRVRQARRITTDRVDVDEPRAVAYEAAATPTEAGGDAGADTRVETGEVTVTASVQVVYDATAVADGN